MMAAAKKGSFVKKKRSDPTRIRRPEPDPDPSPPPSETRRSLRPRQRRYLADFEDELDLEEEEEEEEESKGRRKLKLVLKLPLNSTGRCRDSSPVTAPKSHRVKPDHHVSPPSDYSPSTSRSATSPSSSSRGEEEEEAEEEEEEIVKPLKKRRIERVRDSDGSGHREERRENVVRRPIRAGSGTPMPERETLEAVLDKLQKKDTYGVFAQPVDPEELPDYHDVIEHPMDFGTVRRKLASGRYRSFEQFEDDVFLICSNAMQYNAPDTIYFRQARSIQDMARRNFQEIRSELISSGAERKSEENIRSASNEKNTIKKVLSAIAPRQSSFHFSSEKKTLRQPSRNAIDPLRCDISSSEKKTIKKQHRTTPERRGSDVSPMEKKMLWKPQDRSAREPLGSDVSSMGKKTLNKPQYRTAPEPRGCDVSSIEKKTLKKPRYRTVTETGGFDVSSMEKKKVKKPQYKTSQEPPESDHSSVKKKENIPQYKLEPESEPAGSDISSTEKTTLKDYQSRTETEPLCSDISSQDKKMQNEQKNGIIPEPPGSDVSSGATLTSSADAFAGLCKIPANGNTSATAPCAGFDAAEVEASGIALLGDTSIACPVVKASGTERSVAIHGSAEGNSSPCESKQDIADEIPAKSSPSKLAPKPFINRRVTYTLDEQPSDETDLVFGVFEGEAKQLVAVGLDSEYSYARSLARFAAPAGPVAWEIASKKIEQALPPGVKFGPGWVGEYEPLLTPLLSFGTSAQPQQLPITGKDKGNEIKPGAISTISRKKKGNEMTTEISNGRSKDLSFGCKSQMTNGMPSKRSNPSKEGRERVQPQKPGLFGVNLQLQPCTSSTTLQQQENQPAGALSKVHNSEPAGHRLDNCPEALKPTPGIISQGWTQVQTEAQKQQQKTRVAQARTEMQKLQQQKNQVTGYTNEAIRHQADKSSEVRGSNSSSISYSGKSHVQAELKQLEAVTSQRRNDGLDMNFGASNTWKSCDGRQNQSFGIVTNNQAGVQYWLARGSQEQAVNDPLRWMNSIGKFSSQPNASIRYGNNLEQSTPTVQVPKREIPSASAAQAWMSIAAPAEWKSVTNGVGLPNKQVGSTAFNPIWKTPMAASRVYEEANVKAEPFQGFTENTQAQTKGLVIFPQLMSTDLSRLRSPWQGLAQPNKQRDALPPDLNISFQPPGSPARSSSGVHIDSQQPDLALQL